MFKRIAFFFVLIIYTLPVYSVSDQLKEQAREYRRKGYELQNRGDNRGALSYYTKAIELDPSFKEAYNDVGVVYEVLGDLGKAEEMYLEAIDIDPDYPAPYANLGFLYEKMNDKDKATYYWKRRYELGKGDDYWRQKAVEHLTKLGAVPEAKSYIMEKKAALLSSQIAYKREQEKIKELETAKEHFKLGFQALNEKSYSQAADQFLTVIELNPIDGDLLKKAKDYYKQAKAGQMKAEAKNYLESGLNQLDNEDYLSVIQSINKAQGVISQIPAK